MSTDYQSGGIPLAFSTIPNNPRVYKDGVEVALVPLSLIRDVVHSMQTSAIDSDKLGLVGTAMYIRDLAARLSAYLADKEKP